MYAQYANRCLVGKYTGVGISTFLPVINCISFFLWCFEPLKTDIGLKGHGYGYGLVITKPESDNAYDPDVNAKQIWIDQTDFKGNICLTFTDNGKGMALDKLHKMLSFGFSDKVAVRGRVPVGLYGNGFKSGSMRLGKDAIVFTKNESGMHVGMLSQTYLEKINAEHVLVPIISFNKQRQLVQTPDSDANMEAITTYSLMNCETELLAELETIPGPKGTKIIIWNLRNLRHKHGCPEFDFDSDEYDIRIPAESDGKKADYKKQERVDQVAPDSDYSLRAYCRILYLKPRMQIILRGQKSRTINFTFGYNHWNPQHYGIMMYHKNRLIKAYERVGCQLKNKAVGILGVVECNFLKPTHNKQDFDYTNEYRLTLSALQKKLSNYWNAMKHKKKVYRSQRRPEKVIQNIPGQTWVQCDSCLKWRKVPDRVKMSDKDDWCCSMNMDPQFRDCSVPEESGANDDVVTRCTYEKKPKKRLRRSLSYENTSAKKQKLNGSGPTDLHQDIGTSSNNIVTENVHTCEGDASNDYSSQGNQPMPDSIQREMETSHQTHHQESSNDTMEQENKRLSLKVQELEKQISDLRSKYEESLKEIDRLKAQCKELQDLKVESGTGDPETRQQQSE